MGVYIDKIDLMRLSKICMTPTRSVLDVLQGYRIIEIDLVRCKDCKHYDTESRTFPCCTDIFGAVRYMEADGFCSKGERRADCEKPKIQGLKMGIIDTQTQSITHRPY